MTECCSLQVAGSSPVGITRASRVGVHSQREDWFLANRGEVFQVCQSLLPGFPEQMIRVCAESSLAIVMSLVFVACGSYQYPGTPESNWTARFDDPDPRVREHAAWAMATIHAREAESVASLTTLLADEDPEVRVAAARALGQARERAAQSVDALTSALRSPDARLRWNAALALGLIGEAAAPAILGLIESLKDEDWRVRYAAALGLGELAPASTEARAALSRAQKDHDPRVREAADRAAEGRRVFIQ